MWCYMACFYVPRYHADNRLLLMRSIRSQLAKTGLSRWAWLENSTTLCTKRIDRLDICEIYARTHALQSAQILLLRDRHSFILLTGGFCDYQLPITNIYVYRLACRSQNR